MEQEQKIQQHLPFIVKVVSEFMNRYVEIENSEEFSVALEAFHLALEKYEDSKGHFYPFAKKVITNKLIDYKRRPENKITYLDIDKIAIPSSELIEEEAILKEDIRRYEDILKDFNLDYETLSEDAPKHMDTRKKVVSLGISISKDGETFSWLLQKKRLPLTKIATDQNISLRFLKSHQKTLIAIVLAFGYEIQSIVDWIGET